MIHQRQTLGRHPGHDLRVLRGLRCHDGLAKGRSQRMKQRKQRTQRELQMARVNCVSRIYDVHLTVYTHASIGPRLRTSTCCCRAGTETRRNRTPSRAPRSSASRRAATATSSCIAPIKYSNECRCGCGCGCRCRCRCRCRYVSLFLSLSLYLSLSLCIYIYICVIFVYTYIYIYIYTHALYYIIGAHGRGRSTTVMCACLVKADLYPTWEAAFEDKLL